MSELDDFVGRFGSARRPHRGPAHDRPDGVDDDTVDALGKLSAALEAAEDARGHLYAFHRLSGRADLELQDAVEALRKAGHEDAADAVDEVLVGRDVVRDMWTFEIVEDYDANYLEAFRAAVQVVGTSVGVSASHVFEAEMKHREQSR